MAVDVEKFSNIADLVDIASDMKNFVDELESRVKMGVITKADAQKMLSSNIGNIGISVDYSLNSLRNPIFDQFPLVNWLLNTPASNSMRNTASQGMSRVHKDNDGVWQMLLPWTVYTLPPEDTTGECCWVPFDIAKCGDMVPLALLCLKDCYEIFDYLIERERYPSATDLIGYFQRQGESVKAARDRMARFTMAWLTAWNIINGTMDASTGVLKPFHGLLEVMEDVAVSKIAGANPITAFDSISCRLQVMEGGSYIFAAHPLVIGGIASRIKRDKFGNYPEGWTRTRNTDGSETISFNGIRFIPDKTVPIDFENGIGDVWMIDGETTGAYMLTSLTPTDRFTFSDDLKQNNDPEQGCAEICNYYYNAGTVFNTNPNRLAVITDVPLATNCLGNALQGLEGIIVPNTPAPF